MTHPLYSYYPTTPVQPNCGRIVRKMKVKNRIRRIEHELYCERRRLAREALRSK